MTDHYKEIFYAHYPNVLRKLTVLVGDRAAAEDLAQEAFLRLYRNPPEQLEAVGAWLHRVATRIGYDYLNRQALERKWLEQHGSKDPEVSLSAPSNEDVYLQKLDQSEIKQWLDELPERDRQLLMLKYSGYSYQEIAEKLQVRKPLVGTMLSRAAEKFRKKAEAGLPNG
ncbi:sigma-70 family RNA polymerase sigma factor [Paenibacillus turpanensis]|uniref:sigma-70 family RNA polymerase sigma factor n=1 Tax=Paenibacillus turpanensis TaxID=2689078 RepID=UPI001FB7ED6A|nr:sigma-70 family RNA polymerase sigma factor [Paenibacillus turpanensis]